MRIAERGRTGAKSMLSGKCKASDCSGIDIGMAGTIDRVLSIDIHLPESDPMMQKVPEKLIESQLTGRRLPSYHHRELYHYASNSEAHIRDDRNQGLRYTRGNDRLHA